MGKQCDIFVHFYSHIIDYDHSLPHITYCCSVMCAIAQEWFILYVMLTKLQCISKIKLT